MSSKKRLEFSTIFGPTDEDEVFIECTTFIVYIKHTHVHFKEKFLPKGVFT